MKGLLQKFKLEDSFLGEYEKLIKDVVIPYQEKAIKDEIPEAEKSGAVHNFELAAKVIEGGECEEPFYGMVFQDSDVAKWIEAAAYSIAMTPDPNLEKRVDDLITLIGSAQHADGYLNTYFTVKSPEKRWTNLCEAHELYCAGHMIEAAVAYFEATGKAALLQIMKKMADHIYQHFVVEKWEGYPGHPEIELALMRLYDVTKEEKYLELAAHFINVRGVDPEFYIKEAKKRDWQVWGNDPTDFEYAQNQAPVRQLKEATGHSVRAVYLYSGMAALAAVKMDKELENACKTLWKNIVTKRMYITGGIGSTNLGEAFTKDYHLPNDTAYSETCASIGLIFFAKRLLEIEAKGEYADIMEQALYNCVLAGMQLDGTKFFYVNPLEVLPGISGEVATHKHALPQRPKWFGCACCPPNVARLLASLPNYIWSETKDAVFAHLFVGGSLNLLDTKGIFIEAKTGYPFEGNISYKIKETKENKACKFAVRLPQWSRNTSVFFNGNEVYSSEEGKLENVIAHTGNTNIYNDNGYLYLERVFCKGDEILLKLDMRPKKIYANKAVAAESGKVAITRGPLVYCAEGVDNDNDILGLTIDSDASPTDGDQPDKNLQIIPVKITGKRIADSEILYSATRPQRETTTITFIPYYMWGNRGLNEMRVWLPEQN